MRWGVMIMVVEMVIYLLVSELAQQQGGEGSCLVHLH